MSGALAAGSLAGIALSVAPGAIVAAHGADAPVGQGFNLNAADLRFILQQIKISERHAATATADNPCGTLLGNGPDQIPDVGNNGEELPWGLRTIDGSCNNLLPGRERWGAADELFPRRTQRVFRDAEPSVFGPPGGPPTSYSQKTGDVFDSEPRLISNLIVDQTSANPAAVAAADSDAVADPATGTLPIPNVAPDVGLSAPFNSVFTLFGQFFDHGLDLVSKSGATVYMPLKPDDPLYVPNGRTNFMVVTRSTNQPGEDGVLGTSDDVQEATNQTAPLVDQSQTYTSHASLQVFVREYANDAAGEPVSTGRMLTGPDGGLATWASVKQQASDLLGIQLTDLDVLNMPLLATDQYGKFDRGPNGYPQIVRANGTLLEGDPAANAGAGVLVPANAVRTEQALLVDIAHHAVPQGDIDPTNGPGPIEALSRDTDPGTTDDGDRSTYDDEMLDAHFITGDGRVNENIGLTAIHHVFHAEHNRLNDHIKDVLTTEAASALPEWQTAPGVWNGERIFQAAKFVTEMEYQHLAFEEFARKVQPMVNLFGEGGSGYDTALNPAIQAEFAHAVYRFGHSMLTETVARKNADGTENDIALLDAFLNPPTYTDNGALTPEQAAGSIVRGMSRQVGNEIDEFVTGALRSNLLGLPLDLAAINLARAREAGVPSLNSARRQFYAESNNSALAPYTSWSDFGFGLRHPESLVNFVAAYGTHPSITGDREARRAAAARIVANDPASDPVGGPVTPADSADFMTSAGSWVTNETGLEEVDLWVGGLAEKQMVFGGLLGSTFNYVFELQMEDLQFGDRFYYLSRTAGLNLLTQLEGNSFAEMIHRTTDVSGLPADVFARPDFIFNVGALGTEGPIQDDLSTEYDESDRSTEPGMHLSRVPAGTLRYSGPAHTVFNGTAGSDRIWASEGDDTIRGNDGDDWMQGGDGVDQLIGGLGDDIINDLFGDDTIKGGDGNDAISSGQGFGGDLNQGGRGKDFIVGGNDVTETFAGPGDDFIFAGDDLDTVFGDDGDDWIEGGAGPFNLLQGDAGNPFQDDPDGGHDVLDGDGGEQDFDAEGGDDIMLMGPGIQRAEGMLGFDWTTHKGDPQPADADMLFNALDRPAVEALRDRFDLVEGLSGWHHDDVLRGDDRVADDLGEIGDGGIADGHALNRAGIDRIQGLQDVLGDGVSSYSAGNIILGGGGSDTIEGRGGDDIIDGDAWLDVQLRAPDPATPEVGDTKLVDSVKDLQADVFAGRINPGDITVVRTIEATNGTGSDTAVFSDVRENYDCVIDGGQPQPCPLQVGGDAVTVIHAAGTQADGTDTLTGVEALLFSDTVPPGAPTNVVATAGNASATVAFSAPAAGVVTGFLVRVVNTAGNQVGDLRLVGADARSLRVDGLSNGTSYRFEVRAVNDAGFGPYSARSNAVTPTASVPGAPTIAAAQAGNREATVSWSAGDTGGAAITGYSVRLLDAAGTVVDTASVASGVTSRTVTGLVNGQTYRFEVSARNNVGTGPTALSSSVTPATVPAAPTIGNVTPARAAAIVRWTAPGDTGGSAILGYTVTVLDAAGAVVGRHDAAAGAGQLRVDGLTDGASYRFRVAATNGIGTGPDSAASSLVTLPDVPGRPLVSTATARNGSALVQWTAPTDGGSTITGFSVRVLDARNNQVGALRTASPNSRRLVVTGLANGRPYRFQVAARNAIGISQMSSRSNRVTPATRPGRTRIGQPSPGARGGPATAVARWRAPQFDGGSRITGYRVTALRLRSNGTVASRRVSQLRPAGARAFTMRLAAGRYRFQVRAYNALGSGPLSPRSRIVRSR